jgi:ATP synthase protein I
MRVRLGPPMPCITTKVPYQRPIPEKKPTPGMSGFLGAWVQAEKMVQIALVLPSAAFIGWVIGFGLDRLLHQTWISMVGIVFGIISGLVAAIRMAMVYPSGPGRGSQNGNGTEKGDSGPNS